MDLSIIILNYKSKGLVRTCLRGIKKISLQIKYEIIVVDNNSHDGVEDMLNEEFCDVRFVRAEKNLGHSAGNNLGIRQACGRYVMLLNPDIAVMDDSFDRLVRYMDQHPEVGMSGCKLLNPDGALQYSCRKFYKLLTPVLSRTFLGKRGWGKRHMDEFFMRDFDHCQNKDVEWLQGSCLAVRRSILKRVGLLDERFFLYFGDVDWCARVWRAGFKVRYLADSWVFHYFHRESSGGLKMILRPVGRIHIKDWLKYLKKIYAE